ncbi:PI31 proteasome regulator N-terminal-domain-containing protein [Paraphysoderma sedebokerense]|nr:PI31 proteasome regulator N-terminal-domain-containing protein [Paraphysoderma sedebokerense]
MSSNPLSKSSLLKILQTVLNNTSSGSNESPQFVIKSGGEAIAAFLHSEMIAVGFRLVGLGEEGRVDDSGTAATEVKALPTEWNRATGMYAFRYKHTQSSLTFLIKCVTMANKLQVHGMGIEDGKINHLELNISDFVASSISFPYTISNPHEPSRFEAIFNQSRIEELVNSFKINIIQKLIPGLGKEGYEESRDRTDTQSQTSRTQERREPPRMPIGDPYYGEPYTSGVPGPPNPFSIGRSDLDPLGGMPMLGPTPFGGPSTGWGGLGPEGPRFGSFGSDMESGGMYVGPGHPMFGNVRPDRGAYGGGIPAGPGRGVLPRSEDYLIKDIGLQADLFINRGAVPPGARFDPITPLPPNPAPLPGQPRRPGGNGFRSGEPDPDALPPPGLGGYNDMFM